MKIKKIIGIGIILLIVPIFIKSMIYKNVDTSQISGDGWFSFLGAYIGGALTLIGVLITIMHTELESDRIEKRYDKRLKDEKRMEFIPYLKCEFVETSLEADSHFDLRENIESTSVNSTINITKNLEVKNYGFGPAIDVRLTCFINGKQTNVYTKITSIIYNDKNIEVHNHIVSFSVDKKEADIVMVLFYKDILGNNYAQEVRGVLFFYEDCELGQSNIPLYDLQFEAELAPRVIADETSFTLAKWYGDDECLNEFVNKFFNKYEKVESRNKCNTNDLQEYDVSIIECFIRRVKIIGKEVFGLHLGFGKGDIIERRRNKYGEDIWIYFMEIGLSKARSVEIFLGLNLEYKDRSVRIIKMETYNNTISDDEKKNKKFERELKKEGKRLKT